jgi:hypothetical protein
MNDEQCRSATLTFGLARVSCESIVALKAVAIDGLQPCVAAGFPQNDSQVACTSGTTSGEVFGHAINLTLPVRPFKSAFKFVARPI